MKNTLYRLLLLPWLLLAVWGAQAQAPAWLNAYGVQATGSSNSVVQGVATNAAGDIFVVGNFTGTATFGGTTLTSTSGSEDMFVAKWNGTTNAWVWAVSGGGAGTDQAFGVAVNGSNVYVCGNYSTSTATISGSSLAAYNSDGTLDMFVAKYYDNGTTVTSKGAFRGGGTSSDRANAIAINSTTGTVYVTGYHGIGTGTVLISGSTLTGAGAQDIFVARYTDAAMNASSSLVEGGALRAGGTSTGEQGQGIAVNSSGNIYVTGAYGANGANFSGTAVTSNGSRDMFVAKYTDSGSGLAFNSVVTAGGASADTGFAITTSGTTVYAAGYYISPSINFGNSVSLTNSGGNAGTNDMLLVKYTDSGTLTASSAVSSTGASNEEFAYGVALSGGAVYVTGAYYGAVTISGSNLTAAGSTSDAFVAKYTDSGSLAPNGAISGGGTGADQGRAMAPLGTQVVVAGTVDPSTSSTFGTTTINAGPEGFFARVGQNTTTVVSIVPAAANPTNAASVQFTVTFATSVTGLTATNFTTANGGSVTGSSVTSVTAVSGTVYTVTVNTGSGSGTLGLTLANDTGLTPSISNDPFTGTPLYTIDKTAPAAPVVTAPANGSTVATTTPTYTGTAEANSTVTVYVDGAALSGTVTADGSGNWSKAQSSALSQGSHTVYVTARDAVGNVSANSATNTFTVDTVPPAAPVVTAPANGSTVATTTPTYTGTAEANSTVTVYVDGAALSGTVTANGSGVWNKAQPTALSQSSHTVYVTARDAAGNTSANSATNTFTVSLTTTVASVTRLTPSPSATTQVSYRVVFAASVTGVTVSNFTTTNSGTTVTGSSVSSVSGSGTTYTVTVNTGTGDGTLRLDVANSTGLSPTVSNVPYTTGETYTITKSFAAQPQLTIVGTGGTGSDVTAFVDVAQVLSGGSTFANALQNGSFESHNALANGDYGYNPTGASWTFNAQSGIAESGSAFTPGTPIPNGIAVAFIQSNGGGNGQIQQNLAVPTGSSYQVRFQASQRNCCTTGDQALNVFLNGVFIGTVQPANNNAYTTFTSATFSVTAPALTATVSTTSASPTSTSPIPFSVSFTAGGAAQSVGTTFTASDVTVNGGTLTSGSFSGSGAGPYTFTVTPTGAGTVTVSVAASVANDANNTGNSASNSVSVQYQLPATAAPTLSVSGNIVNGQPTFSGTAPANSTIVITVKQGSTTVQTLTATATAGGSYTYTVLQGQALPIGSYTATATAQSSGNSVSVASNQVSFTVPTAGPTTVLSSTAPNPTTVAPIPVTVKFSRNVFNFSASGVTVSNSGGTAAIGNFTAVDGKTYTFDVTPSATGLITVNVAAGAAQDSLNRNNQAATALTRQYNQPATAAPTITSPLNNSFTNTDVTLAGTAPANSQVVLYLSQNGGAFQPTSPFPASASGTFSIGPVTFPDATYQLYATAQSPGASVSPNSATITFTVDTQRPSVGITSSAGASGGSTGTSPIPFTVTFSEAVSGFVTGDLTVTNGTVSGFTAVSGTTYTFNVTPTTAGTATTVNVPANVAQDQASNFNTAAPAAYSLTFTASTITVAPASLPNGTQGTAYSQTVTASGGTAPYTYAITSGALPTGLTLTSGGVLSGTPTASGTFNFRITATDNSVAPGPYSGFRDYSLTIAAPTITLAPATLPNGAVAAAYSQTITASGGTAPYSYAITAGALPAGLTLTSAGVLAGTPTAGGSFTFTVRATDSSTGGGPYNGTRSYTLTINAPTIAVAPATLPNGTQGTAYSQTITASGGTAPYSYAITAGALPAGLTLASNGTLSGTPTAGGSFTFTVTATDASTGSGPYTGSRSYTISIAAPASVTWNGSVSTDWFTAANWTPNVVPDATVNATIPTAPSGNRFPAISAGTATTNALTLGAGATLTQTGGTLDVRGDLTNNGAFAPTGGTVVLGTTAQSNGPNILGSGNTRFWNLTVNANGVNLSTSATTSVQRLLTLNGAIVTQNNPFVLESDANGTALVVNNGTSGFVFGSATVQRYIAPDLNAGLGYRHYSAPVGTATVASLATGSFTPMVNPAYNSSAAPTAVTPFPTVYGYDQARLATATNNLAAFDKGWFSPSSTGDALTVGQGYTVNLAANQTLNVTGPLNNNTQSLTLNRNSGATAADAGWALVGNPYPAPLDYASVAPADRTNLDAAIYVFESTSQYAGSYRANVNGVGGNANSPNTVLAQGQGFFVRVSNGQTSGTLTFRNSQRLTSYTNPVYHRTAETRPLVQLDLTSATGTDPVYVYFENGATTGVDREMDAVKLPNSHGLNVSAETGAQRLAIDALPALGTAPVTVPLTVGVPAVGSFSFHAAQLLNLATTPVYLRDKQTGAVVDLRAQPSYQFTVSNATALITGRFELVFSPQAVLATAPAALAAQVGLYPNPATTTAFVELPAALGRVAVATELVDALGRTVRTQSLPAQGAAAHRIDLANLATGVYTLHLNTSAGVVVKKLVVQ